MEKYVEDFLEFLKERMTEIENVVMGTSDIEITCKITYKNVPTLWAHSEENQKQLDAAVQKLKEDIAEIPGAKTSVKVKIKDKGIKKSKKKGDK